MRDPRVEVAGSDGIPRAVFGGDTARMNREAQERLAAACDDDAVPSEMVGGETMRIDQTSLTGLIEKSEGVAQGTPKRGMPQLVDDEPEIVIEARGSSMQMGAVQPVGEAVVERLDEPVVAESGVVQAIVAREPTLPVMRQSRTRDVMLGGLLALIVMAAWFCATQL